MKEVERNRLDCIVLELLGSCFLCSQNFHLFSAKFRQSFAVPSCFFIETILESPHQCNFSIEVLWNSKGCIDTAPCCIIVSVKYLCLLCNSRDTWKYSLCLLCNSRDTWKYGTLHSRKYKCFMLCLVEFLEFLHVDFMMS